MISVVGRFENSSNFVVEPPKILQMISVVVGFESATNFVLDPTRFSTNDLCSNEIWNCHRFKVLVELKIIESDKSPRVIIYLPTNEILRKMKCSKLVQNSIDFEKLTWNWHRISICKSDMRSNTDEIIFINMKTNTFAHHSFNRKFVHWRCHNVANIFFPWNTNIHQISYW